MLDYVRGDPWFDDGNVILWVNAQPKDVAFRVHRGVLARSSELFESMFSLPQPSSSSPEGGLSDVDCPVIPAYDEPGELGALIKAIYDGV
jgi:hypothetical protein